MLALPHSVVFMLIQTDGCNNYLKSSKLLLKHNRNVVGFLIFTWKTNLKRHFK